MRLLTSHFPTIPLALSPMDALFLDKLLVAERLREFSRGIHASGVNTKEFACRVATFEEPQTSLRDERVAAAMRSGR